MDTLHAFLLALLAFIVNSIAVALQEHPGDARSFGAALLRALGRASFLRFASSPGTLHLPGAGQPAPPPTPAHLTLDITGGLLEELGQLALAWADQPLRRAAGSDLIDMVNRYLDQVGAPKFPAPVAAYVFNVLRDEDREPAERLKSAPPAIPTPGSGRAVLRALILLPLLLAAPGCASWPEWRAALAACGAQLAPAGVTTGVALALHRGEGWQDALESLVGTYGECLIKAEVLKHLQGQGPPPPTPAAVEAVAPVLGGELTAHPRLQPPAVVQARARAWLALLPKDGGSGR